MGSTPAAGPFARDSGMWLLLLLFFCSGWVTMWNSKLQVANHATKTESLFHTYSQYASMTHLPSNPSEEELRIETQINDILEKARSVDPLESRGSEEIT
jgi:hypothetical protein